MVDVRRLVEERYEQLSPGLFEAVLAGSTELHPIATEVETGEAVDLHPAITDARTLRLALRGSAGLPLLAGPPVELDGRRLIDAGLSAAIPFHAALADGATHVLVLRSRRAGEVAAAPGRLSGALTARALRRLAPALEQGFRTRAGARGGRRGAAGPPRRRPVADARHPLDPPGAGVGGAEPARARHGRDPGRARGRAVSRTRRAGRAFMIGSVSELQTSPSIEQTLEQHRGELTGYCYRMLGSTFEAEDAVQETMVRAWRSLDRFEGRSALRSWLYRIATNVCLDALNGRQRRARPMDLGPAGSAEEFHAGTLPEAAWLEPIPDSRVLPEDGDPAELAASRETLRLAFVNALQHLPPRQRAVLILREVLRWQATEVAELLDTSVASVNSALQRARAQLGDTNLTPDTPVAPLDDAQRELLERYVAAFEQYDMEALIPLLREDASLSMPPYDLWLQGPEQLRTWFLGHGSGCRGSRLLAVRANGAPAFGQYRPSAAGGWEPWALQVLEISDGRIAHLNSFLDTQRLFPLFGLPDRLDA